MTEFAIRVLVAVISSLITAGIFWSAGRIRARLRIRFSKLTYFRVIRLRLKSRGDAPYYLRRHHTIAGHEEEVFDEVWVLNGTLSNSFTELQPVRITSAGVVDALQILPVIAKDADSRPPTKNRVGDFTFAPSKPTNKLVAVGTCVNGLQEPKDWNFSTTAQHPGQDLYLVVDFSSLPYDSGVIGNPKFRLFRQGKEHSRQPFIDSGQWYTETVGNEIFYFRFLNAKRDDMIEIDFEVDESAISAPRGEMPISSKM